MAIFPFNTRYSSLITTITTLLLGTLFAVAHHCFYQALNGQPLSDAAYSISSYKVSKQQINSAVGTLLAFLVRALLAATVSNVFSQLAWKMVKARTTKIAVIDDLFSIISNGFYILDLALWRHYPLAMGLALIFWLLPAASVIAPATLNVRMASTTNSSFMRVPRADFTSLNFPHLMSGSVGNGSIPYVTYMGPMDAVKKVVNAATAQGQIVPIPAPSTNSSWTLKFHGPALSCKVVDGELQSDITENIIDATNNSFVPGVTGSSQKYLSWTPGTDFFGPLPFNTQNGTYQLRSDTVGPRAKSWVIRDKAMEAIQLPISIFVATFPRASNNTATNKAQSLAGLRDPYILQCTLQNVSYVTNFTYVNGNQEINTKRSSYFNDVSFLGYGLREQLLVSPSTAEAHLSPSSYNTTIVEKFSYQSVMEAFGSVMIGEIRNDLDGASLINAVTTSVMTTSLSNTKELSTIAQGQNNNNLDLFQKYWDGYSVIQTNNSSESLLQSIEEIFQNITISLMSSSVLQNVHLFIKPNYSSPYAPPDTNVTIITYRNVYIYSKSILWLAYGTAIGVTLPSVLLGIFAYMSNKGSYSTKFSTTLRATRDASLSFHLLPEDSNGMDPLPEYIAKGEITFEGAEIIQISQKEPVDQTESPHSDVSEEHSVHEDVHP